MKKVSLKLLPCSRPGRPHSLPPLYHWLWHLWPLGNKLSLFSRKFWKWIRKRFWETTFQGALLAGGDTILPRAAVTKYRQVPEYFNQAIQEEHPSHKVQTSMPLIMAKIVCKLSANTTKSPSWWLPAKNQIGIRQHSKDWRFVAGTMPMLLAGLSWRVSEAVYLVGKVPTSNTLTVTRGTMFEHSSKSCRAKFPR